MSVLDTASNSHDRAAMNFSRLLIPVIKTSRSHRCHAMEIVIRFNGIPIRDFTSGLIRFPERTGRSFVFRRDLQRIWEDLHQVAMRIDRYRSARTDARFLLVVLLEFAPIREFPFDGRKKKRLGLITLSLQSHLVACRMDFRRKRNAIEPFLRKFIRGIVAINWIINW